MLRTTYKLFNYRFILLLLIFIFSISISASAQKHTTTKKLTNTDNSKKRTRFWDKFKYSVIEMFSEDDQMLNK